MATKIAGKKQEQQRESGKSQESTQFVGLPKGAEMVDVSVPTLRRWLTEKRLRRFKVGGHTVVETAELLGLVKEVK